MIKTRCKFRCSSRNHILNVQDCFQRCPSLRNVLGETCSEKFVCNDEIEGNLKICEQTPIELAPISLEWTVPFEYGFIHLGVHNLPRGDAESLKVQLLNYTFNKEAQTGEELTRLFALLNDIPDVLVVFNHPLWDIEIVGQERHEELLDRFLQRYRRWINAIEVNGFRSWLNDFVKFINSNYTKIKRITLLFNGPDLGMIDEESYRQWLYDCGIKENIAFDIYMYDKGYAFFRYCIDSGIDHSSTTNLVRFMYQHNINDSRDLTDEFWNRFIEEFGDNDIRELLEFSDDAINIPDLMSELSNYGNITLCGGAR